MYIIFVVSHSLQIHRAFLLTSLFVGALGFLLAFVAHARNPTPGLISDLGTSRNVIIIRQTIVLYTVTV